MVAVWHEAAQADERYGPFTSTHEALGVLSEEWDELREAIHANDFAAIEREAAQVASIAIRLAYQCRGSEASFRRRSCGEVA
jgi:NTP pyrophosphatase (non-canonical NTP hydrolase)